ncbi:MAG: hypothetical protein AAFU53_15850 [Cyanobacteria bacterium J06632_3]
MNSKITQLTTVLFVMASIVALPTAAKAQSNNLERAGSFAFEAGEALSSGFVWCFQIPGYGWIGPDCPPD